MATSRLGAAGAIKGAFEDLMTTTEGLAAHAAGHAAMGSHLRTTPVRCATFGDSTADVGTTGHDCSIVTTTFATHAAIEITGSKWRAPDSYSQAWIVGNGGISGQTTTQMLARDQAASGATRKAIQDIIDLKPDVVFLRGGSINDITSVTPATVSSQVATTYANHVAIINRFLSAGIRVLDEGLYGYSGSATYPDSVRLALTQLNALFAAYAQANPLQVKFINWAGILSDSTGAFLPNVANGDGQGVHLSWYGQYLAGQQEAAALSVFFGPASGPRYAGVNVMKNAATASTGGNSLMFNTTSPGYGTVPTGFSFSVTSATRQNAKVEVINGMNFATCEIVPSGSPATAWAYMPIDAANFSPVNGDVYGLEFWFFLSGIDNAAPPAVSLGNARWGFTFGSNIPISTNNDGGVYTIPLTGGVVTHQVFPPFQFPADTSTLTLAECYISIQSTANTPWKMGVSNPRLVKL